MDAAPREGYRAVMRTLIFLILTVAPCFAQTDTAPPGVATSSVPAVSTASAISPGVGFLESSKIRLDAHDAAGALADAETALARHGGADAYAARADAKRALGRPSQEVLADYAQAAKMDPRYIEKYQGLVEQQKSEEDPEKSSKSRGVNGIPIVYLMITGAAGAVLLAVGWSKIGKRTDTPAAPDDEVIKVEGREQPPEPEDDTAPRRPPPEK
jgi:hypothetical protein